MDVHKAAVLCGSRGHPVLLVTNLYSPFVQIRKRRPPPHGWISNDVAWGRLENSTEVKASGNKGKKKKNQTHD